MTTGFDEQTIDELLDAIPLERWLTLSDQQQACLLATLIGSGRAAGRTLRAGRNNANAMPLRVLSDDELLDLVASNVSAQSEAK